MVGTQNPYETKKVLHNWNITCMTNLLKTIQSAYDIKSRLIYIEGKTIVNHTRYVSVANISSLFVYNWTDLKVVDL